MIGIFCSDVIICHFINTYNDEVCAVCMQDDSMLCTKFDQIFTITDCMDFSAQEKLCRF